MEDNEPSGESSVGEQRTEQQLTLVRDFLDSTFESVERDGYMVSRGAGKIWFHETHGISVPEGAPEWSSHDYELLWSMNVESAFALLEEEFGWSA